MARPAQGSGWAWACLPSSSSRRGGAFWWAPPSSRAGWRGFPGRPPPATPPGFTPPKRTLLERPPLSFGVAPDGAWAYAGLPDSNGGGLLKVVDVAFDVLRDEEVALAVAPNFLLISPDGLRAFVADATRIQLVA